MNIIYLSAVCSQDRFDKLVLEKKITKMPQAQKYHHLLLVGLRKATDDFITVISSYPITGGSKRHFEQETEQESGINYIYPAFIRFPFIRQLQLWINTIRLISIHAKKKNSIIVCDVLNGSVCYAARFLRFFKKIKIVGIVTDVPGLTSGARNKLLPWWKRTIRKIIIDTTKNSVHKCDAYLLLTQAMNDVVNPKKMPYIVIEGHSDIAMADRGNKLESKNEHKTIMYAGGIHKEFGIALLVESFIALNNSEWELHIYGDGNYQKELTIISKEHTNLKYFGMRPNAEIIEAQMKACLMVNPRISNAEYIKYSFPSKTLECMVSGTPLLTTKLAGMPKDYYPYVYLFEEETEEGFKKALREVFSLSSEELHEKGTMAKDFALNNKNNVKQAQLFYSFLKQL
ncbi:MAG: glycosyltransferase [Bacteroidales bacterium]|nr:glycosyltransferase [Bacteroidales bacterium]